MTTMGKPGTRGWAGQRARAKLAASRDGVTAMTCSGWANVACLAACLVLAGQAAAAPVTASVGVADSFGAGPTGQDGDTVVTFLLPDGFGTGGGTDVAYYSEVSLGFNYTLPGAVQTATLRLFTGGWGVYGRARVSVNGHFVGRLTDGDDPLAQDPESAWLDSFNLTPFLALLNLDGTDEVTISVLQAELDDPAPIFDYGAVDFGVLELTVADSGSTVPEPASLALAALGLAAAGAARRRAAR